MNKITLAIETSCDDTSISILEGVEVISLKTFSQIKQHSKYGGVIPEVASRLHSEYIFDVINEAMSDSGKEMKDIDAIAVTGGPGLVNTLQVGITIAKTLSLLLKKPLYDIDHIEAHAYSPFIGSGYKTIPKKAIVLIVSGGHTQIFVKNGWDFKLIGQTKDDSIGEAYDKVSKTLGFSYPGGPILDEIASNTKEESFKCTVSNLSGFDFSYSGLKSQIMFHSKNKAIKKESLIKGFQIAAITQLIVKVEKAMDQYGINEVIVGGGVSANSLLRKNLDAINSISLYLPKMKYTGDNASMIGYLASIKIQSKKIKSSDLLLDASARRGL